jgi:hypothetical protein
MQMRNDFVRNTSEAFTCCKTVILDVFKLTLCHLSCMGFLSASATSHSPLASVSLLDKATKPSFSATTCRTTPMKRSSPAFSPSMATLELWQTEQGVALLLLSASKLSCPNKIPALTQTEFFLECFCGRDVRESSAVVVTGAINYLG